MPTITLEKVTKYYKVQKKHRRGENRLEIGVEDVDLTVEQGEFVFLVGSSGAGKSTLLDLISGKLKPDKGTVSLNGKDLARLFPWSHNQTALLFGKVCQEQTLARRITVEENLRMAAMIGRRRFESAKHIDERIRKVLGLVGMRGAEKMYPGELSIGECRRVELARAMINSPPILVLDEITANLDDDNIWDMIILLNEVNRRGTTVIMATHASKYVNIMRRRVITLVDGHIFGDVERGRYGDVV
ncbi:cell division ATP-binding protein FtsE [uncultured Oscillibacter sp.]|jgi:cell division transport system ATP-binding protein|uniref:cell division ATP-binding protein FtsE n=1 Tax=uncultured Oscillibacter sp. TaxID=876091 RepID=UPI0025F8B562|nr:ATP-binding cassette domain-containing protein [uncultured Oscillibacter sp.]